MKFQKLCVFCCCLMFAFISLAQISDSGWYTLTPQISDQTLPDDPVTETLPTQSVEPRVQGGIPQSAVAEIITPDIQVLADGLQDDPQKIFNFVHDHIKYVHYFGSKKGAELTLLEKSGNDFDQCALLVALLRAAGYWNTQYVFYWTSIPYDDPVTGRDRDLHHWLQLTLANTNWTNTYVYLENLFSTRGYPLFYHDNSNFYFQRMTVLMTVGSNQYYLDPSFKVSEPIAGISLTNAIFSSSISNDMLTAAGGTNNGNFAQGLSESAMRSRLTSYTTNLLNYIQSNAPTASFSQILGGWQITPTIPSMDYTNQPFFPIYSISGMNYYIWNYQPTNIMSSFTVSFGTTTQQWLMPLLLGQRLSIVVDSAANVQLWQDDVNVASQNVGVGNGSFNVTLTITHPYGSWNVSSNQFIPNPTNTANSSIVHAYQSTNATYNIIYGFEPDWGWLQQRENKLDAYIAQGLATSSRQITSESLNIMGLNWLLQTEQTESMLAQQLGVLPQYWNRFGRMAQEFGHGYYIDVYSQLSGQYPSGGSDSTHMAIQNTHFDLISFFASGFEYGVIEQLQNTNITAASTVKMLEIANTNGQAVYLASSTNWNNGYNIQSHLTSGTYSSSTLSEITGLISSNYMVLLPQNGSNHVNNAANSWAGYGYLARQVINGVATDSKTKINGAYNGGFSSDPFSIVNTTYIDTSSFSQPTYFSTAPVSTPTPLTLDPIDTADDTMVVDSADFAIGQSSPRGITLSRYYNGTRRNSNPAGMANGWMHNFYGIANQVPAPQAGLGGTTPAQAAPMLVATATAICTYNGGYNGGIANAKNWLATDLITKWGVDQLTKNGVSVSLGQDTLQYVQQPNGQFTPPANCTSVLSHTNSGYLLQFRHGNTFAFNSQGLLASITDPYNQSLSVAYNSSNWVNTITDWKNRQFTFTYNGSPARLATVTDGTRTVSYGYSTNYNPQGDLVSFVDPDGDTNKYAYDANHQIVAVWDAQNRLVVSNIYNSEGRITVQMVQGLTNKTWYAWWSPFETTETDPLGGEQVYDYDNFGRLVGTLNQLGDYSQTVYDGQNHVVATVTPLGETNQYAYDAYNNILYSVDALNHTNRFVYDNQFNLVQSIDALGRTNYFGYNGEFSLTGETNSVGDWVNLVYSTISPSPGTLVSRTDSAGTTTYGYDTYGQLQSIAYPNGLGTEYFTNSTLGDLVSHVDGSGFTVSFGYNNRRLMTNVVGPTNLSLCRITYDPQGNVYSVSDPKGNTGTNFWSATRTLLGGLLPATPQGSPTLTNYYDSRDYLVKSVDANQQPTQFAYDGAGHPVSSTDPVLRTSTLTYDADGRILSNVNAAGETNSQSWNAKGQLISASDGAGHTSLRFYDANGNQITLTNRNGKTWQFQYDGANRLTNTISPLGRSTSVTFNHQGLPTSSKDPLNQTATYNYDAKGRLTNRTDSVASTFYRYDANDNPTNVVENSLTNVWTYDAYNRVSSYRDVYGNLIQYRYDAAGNVTNLVYPGGHTVAYAYDGLNRMTNVTDWAGRKTAIAYDLDSRVKSIIRPNGSYRSISYDAAGQTTNILEQMSNSLPIALFSYNWTNSGTMGWEFAAPLPHANAVPARTMTYDADNRLATINGTNVSNDLDGNLTSGPLTNSSFASYVYDARNRLMSAGGVTNVYDALDNRIGQISGTNTSVFVVNPNAKLPQMLMRIKNGVTNYYVYGPGLLYQVTETATSTNTLTYHYDYRGSTIALSDDNGIVTDRIEYSAYGLTTYRAGTNDTPFLFNGRFGVQSDPNGLLYMRSRYYNPYLCRFINLDPSGFGGGLNGYVYANGNPVSYLDPFGLCAFSENTANSSWVNTSENSAPNLVMTANPNVNTGPQMGPPGFTPLSPVYDPSQSTTMSVVSPGDQAFYQNMYGIAGGLGDALQGPAAVVAVASMVDGVGELAGAADSAAIRWGPLNGPGPLGESVANTFRGGSYTESVLSEDTTLYRVYGGNSPQIGPYWTRTAPAGPLQSTIDSALNPAWRNTAQNVTTIVVPKGTTIYDGFAAPQGGLLGGGSQVVIPTVNPAWLIKP